MILFKKSQVEKKGKEIKSHPVQAGKEEHQDTSLGRWDKVERIQGKEKGAIP